MKKIITKIISFAIIISLFTACGKEKVKNNETNEVKENKKVIYTSFYPLQNITNLSEGSVILVNGLGLESWMDKFKASIKDLNVVEVSKDVNLLKAEEEHEENENHESEEKHHHGEYDPHIWLSLRNMKVIAKNICDKVVEMDKDNETYYRENLAKVQNRLDDLDKKYSEQLQNAKIKSIITSHEAFASDSEPNLAKMKEVIELAKNEGIKYVFYEELSENKVEETIAKEIGGEVKMLYTIEGQTEEQAKENKDYFELMEENLKALVEATK